MPGRGLPGFRAAGAGLGPPGVAPAAAPAAGRSAAGDAGFEPDSTGSAAGDAVWVDGGTCAGDTTCGAGDAAAAGAVAAFLGDGTGAPAAAGWAGAGPAGAADFGLGFGAGLGPGVGAPGLVVAAEPLPDAGDGAGVASAGWLGKAARKRLATGASILEEEDLTNSPSSFSLATTALLSTPNSLASS